MISHLSNEEREMLVSAARAAYTCMVNGELTPFIAALAQADPETPRYVRKKNKYSQKYSHFAEYINRYAIVHTDNPDHILLPSFEFYESEQFAEPDIRQFLEDLPNWVELGYKVSALPKRQVNFYNPVAVALLYKVLENVEIHPSYVESQLSALKIQHPFKTPINFCQLESPKIHEYHYNSIRN